MSAKDLFCKLRASARHAGAPTVVQGRTGHTAESKEEACARLPAARRKTQKRHSQGPVSNPMRSGLGKLEKRRTRPKCATALDQPDGSPFPGLHEPNQLSGNLTWATQTLGVPLASSR